MSNQEKVFVKISGSDAYTTDNGSVYRWVSNDRCIPPDVLLEDGITPSENHILAREKENDDFMKAYVEAKKDHEYSEEEIADMKANYPSGTVLTDVITGKKIKL